MPAKTKPAKKPLVSKKIKRASGKGKNVSASTATALRAQANADKTAQPGVIAAICTTLSDAKKSKDMLTVTMIVAKLSKIFPDRPEAGMTTTVRAQLSRLPREREFMITKTRDGREMRYAAA